MIEHGGLKQTFVNEKGFNGKLEAAVTLLAVALEKDLRTQRMEERIIPLDDRPLHLVILQRFFRSGKVCFSLMELFGSERRINRDGNNLTAFEAFFET